MFLRMGILLSLFACFMQVSVLLSPLLFNQAGRSFCVQIDQLRLLSRTHLSHQQSSLPIGQHQHDDVHVSPHHANQHHANQHHLSHQHPSSHHLMVHDESISDTSNHNIHLQHCDLCALQMQLHLPEPWLWSLSFDDLGEWKSVFVDRYRNPLLVQRLFIRPLKQAPPWV